MGLSTPAKITGGVTHYVGALPVNALGFGLNSLNTAGGVVSGTGKFLLDVLRNPFSKNTYKDYKEAVKGSFKTRGQKTKEGWNKYRAPTKGKWDKMYGTAKAVSGPTHAIYGGLKYGIGTALDATWRGLATIPSSIYDLFTNDENKKIKIWKGFKDRQKKWRGDYSQGFKDLKTSE